MVYITISDFENYIRQTIDATTEPNTTQVQAYIDTAQNLVDRVSGRSWDNGTHTEDRFYSGQRFTLKNTPVTSITSITDGDGNAVEYELLGDLVEISQLEIPKKMTIVYEGGPTTTPENVKMLTILYTVEQLLQGSTALESNAESISIGSLSITKSIGASVVYNLDKNIAKYESSVRKLMY